MNIILSDLHLGTPKCRIRELTQLLESIDYDKIDKVILNGDILDIEHLNKIWFLPRSHYNIIEFFKELYNQDKLIYVRGNHELNVDRIDKIKIIDNYSYISNNKRITILHGHTLNKYRLIKSIETYLNKLYFRNKNNFILKHIRKIVLNYMNIINELAFEKYKGKTDYICLGHIHKAEIRKIDNITIYNSGDFIKTKSYLVEEQGVITLHFYHPTCSFCIDSEEWNTEIK